MPKIYELEPHVADLIAAGEVVERSASVVKELIENSIDAGAGIITVEINAGGMTYIRVTDNGCGISREDAGVAFLRHATSKLRGAEGLEAINTLGFRGEALAAIAAVSRIEMLTRETGADEGISVRLEAGRMTDSAPVGCPEGTTVIVRDLFFNTPARQKFMKTDRAEGSGVAAVVLRCALSQPGVSIRFIKDGKTEYHTPGDSRIDSCIYSLFGREFSSGLVKAETSDGAVEVEGYVSAPSAARGNRGNQFFFCNGRSINSKTLQAALEQAYRNILPSGKYPSCVLYVRTKPGDVDVNVHPAKTTVKFVSDKNVFDGIYYAALGALELLRPGEKAESDDSNVSPTEGTAEAAAAGGAAGAEVFSGAGTKTAANTGYINSSNNTATVGCEERGNNRSEGELKYYLRENSQGDLQNSPLSNPRSDSRGNRHISQPVNPRSNLQSNLPGNHQNDMTGQQTFDIFNTPAAAYEIYSDTSSPHKMPGAVSPIAPTTPPPQAASHEQKDFRVIGEAHKTYIILEYQNAVWFIDKHAAHERIHFNALKSGEWEPMSQALIMPVISRHSLEDTELLLENAQLLDKLGFTVESFGENAIAVRRIPADIEIEDAEPVLSDICAQLTAGASPEPMRQDEIFSALACKAAIKAGKSSGMRELEVLAARVMSGEITHCPHGRPVAFEITKTTLDKGFKRI